MIILFSASKAYPLVYKIFMDKMIGKRDWIYWKAFIILKPVQRDDSGHVHIGNSLIDDKSLAGNLTYFIFGINSHCSKLQKSTLQSYFFSSADIN